MKKMNDLKKRETSFLQKRKNQRTKTKLYYSDYWLWWQTIVWDNATYKNFSNFQLYFLPMDQYRLEVKKGEGTFS